IAHLPGTQLGPAAGGTIWFDASPAGSGWFVDKTPWEDSEFTTPGNQREQHPTELLTVREHEIGHLLGQEQEADAVRPRRPPAGTRRVPSSDVDVVDVVATAKLGSLEAATANLRSRSPAMLPPD